MSEIRVLVLGAGQEVGRSCVVVRLGGRTVMFDCGMHAGRRDDARRFPLLRRLTTAPRGSGGGVWPAPGGGAVAAVDAVLVSHFHLDHVGALPYLVGVLGYRGPVVMTAPTAAVTPIMLDDYRRGLEQVVTASAAGGGGSGGGARNGQQRQQQQQHAATFAGAPAFSREHVAAAMSRVVVIGLRETLDLRPHLHAPAAATTAAAAAATSAANPQHPTPPPPNLHGARGGGALFEVTAYYAGHVLGACMFNVRAGDRSVLYTGDHSGLDAGGRHLSAARLPPFLSLPRPPDLAVSEATYASSVRGDGGRAARERALLDAVERCVLAGGRALFPVYAVGRAQELMALVEDRWRRSDKGLVSRVPVYTAGGMAARASAAYCLLAGWAAPAAGAGGADEEEEGEDDDDGGERGGGGGDPFRFVCSASRRARAFRFPLVRPLDRAGLARLLRPQDDPSASGGGGGGGGPCVLFASPGTLGGGASLAAFRAWAPDPRTLVVLPSYQVAGTLGCRLLAGETRGIELPADNARGGAPSASASRGRGANGNGNSAGAGAQPQKIDVRCQVRYAPFSAHADAAGILRVLDAVAPRAAALVHGDRDGMEFLAARLRRCPPGGGGLSGAGGGGAGGAPGSSAGGGSGRRQTKPFPVFWPKTGEEVVVPTEGGVTVLASRAVLDRAATRPRPPSDGAADDDDEERRLGRALERALARENYGCSALLDDAVLLADADPRAEAGVRLRLATLEEARRELASAHGGGDDGAAAAAAALAALRPPARAPSAPPPPVRLGCYVPFAAAAASAPADRDSALDAALEVLRRDAGEGPGEAAPAPARRAGASVRVGESSLRVCAVVGQGGQWRLRCSWFAADEALAERCVRALRG